MGNTFGKLFRITTFGESHGPGVGVVVDGCPAGLKVTREDIQFELDRRRPGQSALTTARGEADQVQIQSGIYEETTLGNSIGMYVQNKDAKSEAYDEMKTLYRPSHADYTFDQRYGIRDWRGGGRSSVRESVGRVAGGAIAKLLLKELTGMETLAWVEQVHDIRTEMDMNAVTLEQIESNPVRCPDPAAAAKMEAAILDAKHSGNSLGGLIRFAVKNPVRGLGNPVFDKITADLAKALISINASRSFSIGLGELAVQMTGEEHNDLFVADADKNISMATNKAGGVLGGITSGELLYGTVSFKPTATILKTQKTVSKEGDAVEFKGKGRHDPCVLPRAVPIVEAMINLVLADHVLQLAIAKIDRLKRIFQ